MNLFENASIASLGEARIRILSTRQRLPASFAIESFEPGCADRLFRLMEADLLFMPQCSGDQKGVELRSIGAKENEWLSGGRNAFPTLDLNTIASF
jgi:hypothetical protein